MNGVLRVEQKRGLCDNVRPAPDPRDYCLDAISNNRGLGKLPLKGRADDAFMHELVSRRLLAAKKSLGHTRRGSSPTWGPVDTGFAEENQIAVGARIILLFFQSSLGSWRAAY